MGKRSELRVSRFVGVAWDEKRRKWKVTLNELDGKDRTIGRYDDEREAAYARNRAVLDAGLEGRRRMNAVDEHGVLVPPGAPPWTRSGGRRSAVGSGAMRHTWCGDGVQVR